LGTSRFTGSRFSSRFGGSRFGRSFIGQPRFGHGFGFGDGDFDFDDGFGRFGGFGFGCFGCGFGFGFAWPWGWGAGWGSGFGWGLGPWWWDDPWLSPWWGWPASYYPSPPPVSYPPPYGPGGAESAPITLLYLKDGRTLAATDYWVADGKLHYRVSDGGESTLDINDLDLQRTVDENAKRGVPFTLKPQPGG
jgi:hypothetical protein